MQKSVSRRWKTSAASSPLPDLKSKPTRTSTIAHGESRNEAPRHRDNARRDLDLHAIDGLYLTQCINQMILESQLPHKIDNTLFPISNRQLTNLISRSKQQVDDFVDLLS